MELTKAIFDFFKDVTASVAWPITIIILAILFRAEFGKLLDALRRRMGSIRKATGPAGLSLEFGEALEEAREAQEHLQDESEAVPSLSTSSSPSEESSATDVDRPFYLDHEKREQLKKQSPTAALLVLYTELEVQLRAFYESVELPPGRENRDGKRAPMSPHLMLKRLIENGYLPQALMDILWPLSRARNALAHGMPGPQDQAEIRELVDICASMTATVSLIRGTTSPGLPQYAT
ncbi:hypothetical protein GCM10009554_50610 [Kribbella koreensis]|uniref:DUF4145 domain-containing protein n=1 Tax=Kribbella koreensis TaxID=57909 RepID=A0ABN1R2B7_9ACTN